MKSDTKYTACIITMSIIKCSYIYTVHYLEATLLLSILTGGILHGQVIPPPGRRRKSNWQQI